MGNNDIKLQLSRKHLYGHPDLPYWNLYDQED